MKNFLGKKLVLEACPGRPIQEHIREAVCIAADNWCDVEFLFNGALVQIHIKAYAERVEERWRDQLIQKSP